MCGNRMTWSSGTTARPCTAPADTTRTSAATCGAQRLRASKGPWSSWPPSLTIVVPGFGERLAEEGRPQVVRAVAHAGHDQAVAAQPAAGRFRHQAPGELDPAHPVHAPGDVGVLAVEGE